MEFVARVGVKLAVVVGVLWVMRRVGWRLAARARARRSWPQVPRRPQQRVDTELSTALDREAAVALCRGVLASFDGVDEHVSAADGSTVVQGLLRAGQLELPCLVLQFEVAGPGVGRQQQVRIGLWPLFGVGWRKECTARLAAVRHEWREREHVQLVTPPPA